MADTTTRKPGNPAGIPVSTTTPKPTREFGKLGPHASDEIGRASCRERVSVLV